MKPSGSAAACRKPAAKARCARASAGGRVGIGQQRPQEEGQHLPRQEARFPDEIRKRLGRDLDPARRLDPRGVPVGTAHGGPLAERGLHQGEACKARVLRPGLGLPDGLTARPVRVACARQILSRGQPKETASPGQDERKPDVGHCGGAGKKEGAVCRGHAACLPSRRDR